MKRSFVAFVLLVSTTGAGLALAEGDALNHDDAALKLRKEAIETDYLAGDYGAAESKLGEALGMCGGNDCSPKVRARIRCDLGAIYFAQGKPKDARTAFVEAIADDAAVTIDKDLTSPPLEAAFGEAKSEGTKKPAPVAGETNTSTAPDKADCPPGFPGCAAVKGTAGAACDSSAECDVGFTCNERLCQQAEGEKPGVLKEHWLSLAFQQDFLLVPSATDACNGGNGYACFNGDQYYENVPLAGADNQVGGGLGVATRRVLLGYDYALNANFLLGGRAGYGFSGGPTRPGAHGFMPFHLEARAAYFFGAAPLTTTTVKLFVAAGLGLAEYDAKVPVTVYDDRTAYKNGDGKNYDAWKKSGNGFVSLGLGSMIPLGVGNGIIVEAKFLQMLATSASGFGLQLGYTIGL